MPENKEHEPANPMIAEALREGKDATGLCTVREIAGYMIEKNHEFSELSWEDDSGNYIRVRMQIMEPLNQPLEVRNANTRRQS